jgi:GT2 family glycosyltransferase
MDADDISLPTRLEKQKKVLDQRPEIAVLGTFVSHTNDKDEVLSLSPTGPTSVAEFEELRRRGEPTLVFGGTAMYRRELFERVGGFDATLRAAADLEFCDRMAEHGAVIAIPEPLLLYRIYSSSNVMLRFREGRRTHRYLAARRIAGLNGDPLPTRDEYVAAEAAAPWWHRLRVWMDDASQYNYRRAGLAYASGDKVDTAIRLVAAGLTGPVHVGRRIWGQRLSPQARRARHDVIE